MDRPIRLDLEITRKCQYKCGVCSVRAQQNISEREISLKELQNKVFEFYQLGGKEISITGGEPSERGVGFLYELILFCKKLKLHVRMYSVGYDLQNLADVQILKDAGLDSVYLTLAGPPQIDEMYKGVKGSYKIAINAIKLFLKCKIDVVMHFTPTKLNYQHFPYVVNTVERLGVKKIRVMAFVPQGRGWDNRFFYTMNKNERESFNEILYTIKEQKKMKLQFSGVFDVDEAGDSQCMMTKDRLVITSEGRIIPSFAFRMNRDSSAPDEKLVLGHFTESIKQAWNSPILINARTSEKCGYCDSCKHEP